MEDVNDSAPVFEEIGTIRFSEETNPGVSVAALRASDPDSDTRLVYTLQAGDTDTFRYFQASYDLMGTEILVEICGDSACCRLDEATGELSLAERVDREEREVYRLVARASDGTHHTDINLTLLVCNISKPAIMAEIVCGTRF